MGCMLTFECLARCLDSMVAFDDALRAWTVHSATPPAFVNQSTFETEIRFFSYADMEEGKHLAPFAVYAWRNFQTRRATSRVRRRGGAYYSVPASLVMSVYAGMEPRPLCTTPQCS